MSKIELVIVSLKTVPPVFPVWGAWTTIHLLPKSDVIFLLSSDLLHALPLPPTTNHQILTILSPKHFSAIPTTATLTQATIIAIPVYWNNRLTRVNPLPSLPLPPVPYTEARVV